MHVLRFDHEPGPQEAILLAPRTNPYPYTRQDLDALVRRLLADARYRHSETESGLLLFVPTN